MLFSFNIFIKHLLCVGTVPDDRQTKMKILFAFKESTILLMKQNPKMNNYSFLHSTHVY